MEDVLVRSESDRGVLLGAFVSRDLASRFQAAARGTGDVPADAVRHALEMYVTYARVVSER